MGRRGAWMTGVAFVAAGAAAFVLGHPGKRALPGGPPSVPVQAPAASASAADEGPPPADDARSHAFRIPSGRAPSLTCQAARTIVSQVRTQLGYAPERVDPSTFVDAAVDWLDPYGLWS